MENQEATVLDREELERLALMEVCACLYYDLAENDLPQRLALLKLTQMAAELYKTRTIDQKRVILTKLFSSFTYSDGAVSVKYSKFAEVIANKTLKTKEILGR